MLIFIQKRLVYLANPKTGTTSFESRYGNFSNFRSTGSSRPGKHFGYARFAELFPYFAENYEVITCVREPLDTLYSWYRYRLRPGVAGTPRSTEGLSFSEFVTEWAKDEPAECARLNVPGEFLLDKEGNVAPIKLFRYMGTPSIEDYAAHKLGIESEEVWANASPPAAPIELDFAIETCPKLVRANAFYNSLTFESEPVPAGEGAAERV